MMRAFSFIALIAIFSQFTAHARECDLKSVISLFKVKPYIGTPIVGPDFERLKETLPYTQLKFQAFHLGSGAGGGVSRIIPHRRPAAEFIVKKMRLWNANKDYLSLNLLEHLTRENEFIQVVKSKILKTSQSEIAYLQLENTRGQTLYSILADPSVPAEVKSVLKKRYEKGISQLLGEAKKQGAQIVEEPARKGYFFSQKNNTFEALEAQPGVYHVNFPRMALFLEESEAGKVIKSSTWKRVAQQFPEVSEKLLEAQTPFNLLLKSDNVIVTPELQLMVIDPF